MYITYQDQAWKLDSEKRHAAARIELPVLLENGTQQRIPLVSANENHLLYQSETDCVEITVDDMGDGLLRIRRNWKNLSASTRKIQTVFGVSPCFEVKKYLIPCVSINGNEFGGGLDPKGLERDGKPWIFAYDRVSIPSCTLTENAECAVSLFASNASEASLISSCSIRRNEEGGMTQEIYHPVIESPVRYSSRDLYSERYEDFIELSGGECFDTEMYVLISKPRWENYGICHTLDVALQLFDGEVPDVPDSTDIWNRSITFAKSLLTYYKDKRGFIIGFIPNGEGGFTYRDDDQYFELAWCGQNVLFSRMFIKDYILNGDPSRLQDALEVLDTRVKYCKAKSGLVASQLKHSDKLEAQASDTCNMGYGAYEFMRTYALLKEIGIDKEEYLQAGLGICDFFLEHFSDSFGFGKQWRHDGVCLDQGGTIGGFLIPAFAKAFELTREEKYLAMAEKAMAFYVKRDLDQFCCTAGALDTCCVDKETSAPFIMGAVLLYELTKKPIYLEYGKKAAYYFTSWMFHYQPCYRQDDEITRYGVSVRGLTAVSTQHHHVDMYGGIVVPYLRRLADYTGDEKWRARADLMWAAVLQKIGDGEWSIHGMKRPVGSQNEAIFHCNWGFRQAKRGDLNDWLVAWPCAFRLSVLAEEL